MNGRILRKKDFLPRLGFSMATLDRKIKNGEFPHPLILGPNMRGWYEEVIELYINDLHNNSSVKPQAGAHRGRKTQACSVNQVEPNLVPAAEAIVTSNDDNVRINLLQSGSSNVTTTQETQVNSADQELRVTDEEDDNIPHGAILAVAMAEEMKDFGVKRMAEDKVCCLLNDTWVDYCGGETLTAEILSDLMQMFPVVPHEVECGGYIKKMYRQKDLKKFVVV